MHNAEQTSNGCIIRAQERDPNGMRCLVENCPRDRAVEVADVVPRERSADHKFMTSIEWSWNMRKGTLNLDCHRNIFFLGASLHSLYKSGLWALLPEEHIVDRYMDEPPGRFAKTALEREEFPVVEGETFQYTFLPLSDMSSFGITRQNQETNLADPTAFTTHLHPFSTLPSFTSHVHPNFVILRIACLLHHKSRDPYVTKLRNTNPVVRKLHDFFPAWVLGELPPWALTDPTFTTVIAREERKGEKEEDEEGEDSQISSETQSDYHYEEPEYDSCGTCTPPRRIWFPPPKSKGVSDKGLGAKRSSSEVEDLRFEHRGKYRKLSAHFPHEHSHGDDPQSNWTKESTSDWARHCSNSPPPTGPCSGSRFGVGETGEGGGPAAPMIKLVHPHIRVEIDADEVVL
ncbi:hypothetical protein D9611_011670 [Ephemerocybe angulata]|uniref:HNH nuclease domain-containing protein n=1 Tax=Ephemerocybe angulata TaxID=980116 RepID=A0A8H5C5E2_9AGAR|nr:hypothetical protein D9611_011670 [Tulosesus angulatus]